jgi:1-acyl-sn-glycerol-3-phosphate acyltransferase
MMMTFWPRYIFHWVVVLISAVALMIMTIGVENSNTAGPIRTFLINTSVNCVSRMLMFTSGGIIWHDCKQLTTVCYKEFLGPDWKPKFDGSAPTLVGNHTSWLDIMTLLHLLPNLSGFVARKET